MTPGVAAEGLGIPLTQGQSFMGKPYFDVAALHVTIGTAMASTPEHCAARCPSAAGTAMGMPDSRRRTTTAKWESDE